MGIDIYLDSYEAWQERTAAERAAFDLAVSVRERERNPKRKDVAQQLVELAAEKMWDGATGYLRSSYNSGGLFNVLDRIFGTDSAALLFPGDWRDRSLKVDWDTFLAIVRQMQRAASCLKHGDPLPVQFDELQAAPHPQRQGGEALGKALVGMITEVAETLGEGLTIEAGNDHQHGFYNEDDYGWYVTEGLSELERFGKLGKKLADERKENGVYISY